jgi:phosphoribosylamine--glycine ligase
VLLLEAAVTGRLDQIQAEWDRRTALAVVMAAAGYPEAPRKGDTLTGLPKNSDDVHVFHAGTVQQGGQLVVSGGRVLAVTALGDSVRMAQARAYEVAAQIHFDGSQMRRDIGYRALERRSR